MAKRIFAMILLIITISLPASISQSPSTSNTSNAVCNGIVISYVYNSGYQIPPTLLPSDPNDQPYRFESTLTVLNAGADELQDWQVFVGFQHREFLVSASNAVLAGGNFLPADVSNGTIFSGSPVTDLKTAIETAGDINQMRARVDLVGTQFGVAPPNAPLPSNLTLVNDGFLCTGFNMSQGGNRTQVCCIKDLNATAPSITIDESPLQNGDLSIMFDVLSSMDTNYWAQVTISNQNPITRIDQWELSWEWMRGEFIYAMRGAYPTVLDVSDCIFGPQGLYYKDLDFSTALSCQKIPTFIDLPPDRTNDPNLGVVPFCCRNGSILPATMNTAESKSAFRMQVYKLEPDLNKTALNPPQNWMINGTLAQDYVCGQPIRVPASVFPNAQGLSSDVSAIASWQIVCNISKTEYPVSKKPPNCCVSFSSFFNETVIPCNTCACGCSSNQTRMCNATAAPVLLPPELLLIPFDNRTTKALANARLHHRFVPNLLPCPDNCGVSINWHLLTDYKDGWTARITIFNWGESDIVDWSAAVELDKAAPGIEAAYSFNHTLLTNPNDTIFLFGFSGLNYLIAEHPSGHPRRDPPVPGSQQSVISFTKEKTPGISVARGDGFPSKVYFNGEDCSIPTMLPIGFGYEKKATSISVSIFLSLMILIALLQNL